MKKLILIFGLLTCLTFSSVAQETPIELIQEARVLVKDSAETVENPKALVKEAEALLKNLKALDKQDKQNKKSTKEAKPYRFQVGLTYQPFAFKNYEDENEAGGDKTLTASGFNGFALGLAFRKPLTKRFSLKSELTYSQQNEKYEFSTISFGFLDEDQTYIYDGKVEIEYNLFKMPVLADYSFAFGADKTWFLHAYTGLQFSYLTSYTASRRTYEATRTDGVYQINQGRVTDEFIDKSGQMQRKSWEYVDNEAVLIQDLNSTEKHPFFRDFSLGIVAGFEVERLLNDKFVIGLGTRYEYNLSQSEENDFGIFGRSDTSTQRRLALTVSVSRLIH
jgi:hypothetical protein